MRKLALCCLILVLMTVWVLPVFGAQSDIQKQKDNLDNKMSSITQQKKDQQKKLNSAVSQKNSLANNQKAQNKAYQDLVDQVNDINGQINDLNGSLKDSEDKYDQQNELFKTRLRAMYENSDRSYIETLVEAKSISDFFERLELISRISKNDKDMMDLLYVAKKDAEEKKKSMEGMKLEKQKAAGESLKTLDILKVSRANVEDQIKQISSTIDQLDRQEDEILKQSQQLESQIRGMQKGAKYAGGSMVWPSPSCSTISSPFGNRYHPILKRYQMHTGIDIAASYGATTVAANSGTVIFAGWQSGYGYTIIIDHGGGISTLYGHSSKLLVSVGQHVDAGQAIARVGSTGLSTGPHLHFEVRKNGVPTDPLGYVSP